MTSPARTDADLIGVDVSGATMRAALLTTDGQVVERREAALERDGVVAQVARVASELRDLSARGVSALGLGVPGLVSPSTGNVVISTDMPSLVRGGMQEDLARATGLPVLMENDANAAAFGEYAVGAGRGSRNMFYITIGTGIGGALVLDGRLWKGASGFAGEIGHITITPEGVECACGNTGCLETVASAPNIVRRTHERLYRDGTSSLSRLAMNKDFTAADIAHEARAGDDFALLMIERTGRHIGTAVASVINLLNIERIVLGGGVMDAGELILNPIIREAGRRSFQPCFEATQIVAASLGADAVPVGAGLLAHASQSA
ncbi:MAG TPA: ROK family protein [Pyrinomonadaceae bacterium]|nr:ROK family protein [Pyrinomonadaceae bacterium]